MERDRTVWQFLETLSSIGVGVIRGVPASRDQVASVARRIGPVQTTTYGRTWNVVVEPSPINVAYTSVPLAPHADLMYNDPPPGIQLLHFVETNANGGSNCFVDGVSIAEELRQHSPDAFATLVNERVCYHKHDDERWLAEERPLIELDTLTGEVTAFNLSLPFHSPQWSTSNFDAMLSLFEAIDEVRKLVDDPRFIVKHRFDAGDCVIFHNRRVLHGRDEISLETGSRLLQGCYVSSGDFESRLRLLRAEHSENLEDL